MEKLPEIKNRFILESSNNIVLPTLDKTEVNSKIYVEITELQTNWEREIITFRRKAYVIGNRIVQEAKDEVLDDEGNVIEEGLPEILGDKIKYDLPEINFSRLRYFDTEEIENIFTILNQTITPENGYFIGNLDAIKSAIILQLNSDKGLLQFNFGTFNFIK